MSVTSNANVSIQDTGAAGATSGAAWAVAAGAAGAGQQCLHARHRRRRSNQQRGLRDGHPGPERWHQLDLVDRGRAGWTRQ